MDIEEIEERKPQIIPNKILEEVEDGIKNRESLSCPGNNDLQKLLIKLDSVETYLNPKEVNYQIKQLSLTEISANILKAQAESTISSMQDTSWSAILQNISMEYPFIKKRNNIASDWRGNIGDGYNDATNNQSRNNRNDDCYCGDDNDNGTNNGPKLYEIDLSGFGRAFAPDLFIPKSFSLVHSSYFADIGERGKTTRKRGENRTRKALDSAQKAPSKLIGASEAIRKVGQVQKDTTIERLEKLYNRLKQLNTSASINGGGNYRQQNQDGNNYQHSQVSSSDSSVSESSRRVHMIPVPLCYLCLDSESYPRTIENFFDLECLVRSGRATKRVIRDQDQKEYIYSSLGIDLKSSDSQMDSVYVVCDLNKKYDKRHAGEKRSEWDPETLLGDNSCLTLTPGLWKRALRKFGMDKTSRK